MDGRLLNPKHGWWDNDPAPSPNPENGEIMKRFTICATQNGYIVVDGNWNPFDRLADCLKDNRIASFNSLDKAISHIRGRMKAMHPKATQPV